MKIPQVLTLAVGLLIAGGCAGVGVAVDARTGKAVPPRNVTVWYKDGGFGGWPANNGAWSWGDEILVAFSAGTFKATNVGHAIDNRAPSVSTLARSLDGGETWTIETFESKPAEGNILPADGLDFTNPDFAMTVRGRRFFYSYDRGHTWTGPIALPDFGLKGIAGRTDYLVNGKHDCIAFLSANSSFGREGRPFCARTTDGGKTWTFLSWIGGEYAGGYSIMPSSLRVSNNRIITALRVQDTGRSWIPIYASDDDGKTWELLSTATIIPGFTSNPPAMIKLHDGRIALSYGYRYPPYGIHARISSDEGKTWSSERVLRADGGCWDLGYARAAQRIDGKIVTAYYFNNDKDKERYIGATIWDPDYAPPIITATAPRGSVSAKEGSVTLTVQTDKDAVCKLAAKPGVAYDDMPSTFEKTGGVSHSTVVRGLRPGQVYSCYVRTRGKDGTASYDDFKITFFVIDPANPPLYADDARLTAPMAVVPCEGASQGKAVASPTENEGRAEYDFTAPRDGEYVVWTYVLGPTYDNDSFFVSVDGGPEDIFDVNASMECGPWRWVRVNGHDNVKELTLNPRVFKLSKGAHTLAFRARDPLTYLDAVIVTDDVHFTPAGE